MGTATESSATVIDITEYTDAFMGYLDGERKLSVNTQLAYSSDLEDFQDYLYKFFQMRAASDDTFINPREAKESFMDKMPDVGSLNKKNLYYNLFLVLLLLKLHLE